MSTLRATAGASTPLRNSARTTVVPVRSFGLIGKWRLRTGSGQNLQEPTETRASSDGIDFPSLTMARFQSGTPLLRFALAFECDRELGPSRLLASEHRKKRKKE